MTFVGAVVNMHQLSFLQCAVVECHPTLTVEVNENERMIDVDENIKVRFQKGIFQKETAVTIKVCFLVYIFRQIQPTQTKLDV